MIQFKQRRNRIAIVTDDKQNLDLIRQRYTVPNPKVRYSPYASLTISPISPLGSFQIGMFKDIFETTEELFPTEEIDIEKNVLKTAFPRIRKHSIDRPLTQAENTEFVYRDYQQSAIEAALDGGRGVILLPTRSGKSLVIYGVYLNSKTKKTLVVVPNIQLVKQMYGDFIQYGCDKDKVQVFSGYSHDLKDKEGIIITNAQYLLKHPDEIPEFDTLVIDEVHGMKKGSELSKWVKNQEIPVSFGYTGTLPESQENIWNIKSLIGPILYEKTVADMQKNKILADVKIYPIRLFHTQKEKYVINDFEDIVKRYLWECGVLENCEESNNIIMQIAKNLKGNTLVLFDHIEHGNKLFEMLDHDNKCFVDGSVKLDDREVTRQKMSVKQNCITVANVKCFGTGITLKQIQNIVFAMSGKGVTKIIQAIGRSLERNKLHANLIDIFHNYKYSTRHFEERVKLYKQFYDIDIIGNDIKKIEI